MFSLKIFFLQVFSTFPQVFLFLSFSAIYFFFLFSTLIPMLFPIEEQKSDSSNYLRKVNSEYNVSGLINFAVYHMLLFLNLFALVKTSISSPGVVTLEYSNGIAFDAIKNFKKSKEIYGAQESFFIEAKSQLDSPFESKINESRLNSPELFSPPLFEFVPSQENNFYFDNEKNIVDFPLELGVNREEFLRFAKENYDFCTYCLKFRPIRTHHCKICNICVINMDHHCEWLNSCIGEKNIKCFMNMLFYCFILIVYMLIFTFKSAWETIFYSEDEISKLYFVCLNFIVLFLLSLRVLGLIVLHLSMILSGQTTREFIKNKKSSRIRRFDLGYMENFKKVFGEEKIYWFFPV